MAFRTNKMPVLQEKSASGAVATFNTALAMPLKSCNIALTATQSGSGVPSPDNVRPISGYSAINISATGKNLFSSAIVQGALYKNGNENTTTVTRVKTYDYIPCKPNTQYTVSFNSGVIAVSVVYYDNDKVYLDGDSLNGATFTTPDKCSYVRFGIAKTETTQSITPSDVTRSQLELGDIVTTYEAYNGIYTTIQIGSTVYGGELDVLTGIFTVTKIFYKPTSIYNKDSSSEGVTYFRVSIPKPGVGSAAGGKVFCNVLRQDQNQYSLNSCRISTQGAILQIVIDQTITTVKDAKQWLLDNDCTFIYELAEPEVINLGGMEIETLQGVNNIWADTGDISLTYKDLDIAKRGNFREVFKLPS